jgi:hypothetical protein
MQILPIPVAREDLDLRLRSVRMPPEAIVFCEMLVGLDELDHRLAGCIWKILGREVAPTETIPDYPFLRLSQGNTTWRQVQIWVWEICLLDSPVFAEYRWHPDRGEHLHFVSLSQHPTQRMKECNRLNTLFEVTKYRYRLGRPLGSGDVRSNQELLDIIIPIIESSWREGIRPTEKRVVSLLPRKIGERRLRKLCAWMGEPWDPFIERVRREMLERP